MPMGLELKLFAPLSPNVVSSLIIVTFLSVMFIIVGNKIGKHDPKSMPKGFLFFWVWIVDSFNEFIREHLSGDRFKRFGPYLFSILMYLVFANTVSLFGLQPPLANLGVAMTFSVITFFLIKFSEMKYQGVLKKLDGLLGYVKPLAPIMLPINLIGEFSTPVTMGMRLFGNLMSGMVISVMIYTATGWFAGIIAGVFVHAIFDIFFGLIQAFVFFMLSLITLSMASDS
jgi:F-type H+-transporting ATPase subunit a